MSLLSLSPIFYYIFILGYAHEFILSLFPIIIGFLMIYLY